MNERVVNPEPRFAMTPVSTWSPTHSSRIPLVSQHRVTDEGRASNRLSGREREVLTAIVRFGRPSEAAGSLHISPHTLKIHLTRIYDKLGVSNRTGAVVEAFRRGELSLELDS